jgi:hypothetical protein
MISENLCTEPDITAFRQARDRLSTLQDDGDDGPIALWILAQTDNTRSLPTGDGTTMVHCPPSDVLLSHCRQTMPHAAASPPGPDRFGTMEVS